MFEERVTFKPADIRSKTTRQLTRNVAATSERIRKVKVIATSLDPERLKQEAIKRVSIGGRQPHARVVRLFRSMFSCA